MLVDFGIWVVFYCSLLFILSALIGSQQVWVSECTCSKYRFLQQPGICAVWLFTKLLDMLDYRQPSCRQENTEEMLMFISSLQRGCQPCFSFAERNNLRLFFPSSSCFSCSAPKLSLLRNFSLAENMRILFFVNYLFFNFQFSQRRLLLREAILREKCSFF